ncbi:MAG: type II toxin-antitoxin system VapC family toxin [Oscillospiraceae bacterium]|nr:type II toxin-antitoxin system VapC family toxin [Oscillospiraceae bacterium]
MDYILDTCTLLWLLFEPEKLSKSARQIILDKNCHKSVSVVSLWEISVKNRIKKLELPYGVSGVFDKVKSSGFGFVPIEQEHIEAYNTLPLIHRDPFDGIIVATALVEQMTILTSDTEIQKYDAAWTW